MDNALLHDKIERYLLGELSPEEIAGIETEMAADPELKQQVEIQRLGLLGLGRLAGRDLQQKFAVWDAELDASNHPESRRFSEKPVNIWKWATAGLLVLLAVTVFLLLQKRPPVAKPSEEYDSATAMTALTQRDSLIVILKADYQKTQEQLNVLLAQKTTAGVRKDSLEQLQIRRLREELVRKDAIIRRLEKGGSPGDSHKIAMNAAPPVSKFVEEATTRGSFDDGDATLAAALKAIENQHFQEAERLLKGVPQNDPLQLQVVHLLPYTLFYGQKFDAAIPAFIELKNQDRFETKTADWYLLLCYVSNMEKYGMKAGVLLKEILIDPEHPYFEAAKRLEARLREGRWL